MQRIIKPLRLVALVMIPLVLASSYLLSLYGLQIINGSAYYEQSRNNIVITEIVPASRAISWTDADGCWYQTELAII